MEAKPTDNNSLSPIPGDAEDVFESDPGLGAAGSALWTAVFDYEATAEDELSLRRGDVVELLSKDSLVSGDEGWWTGMIADRVGIFPSNYVSEGQCMHEEDARDSERVSVPPLHREYLSHCSHRSQSQQGRNRGWGRDTGAQRKEVEGKAQCD